MEQVEAAGNEARGWFANIFNTDIVNGQSLADFITLDSILGLLGSLVAAIVILIIGLFLAGWVQRRVRRIADRRKDRDNTLFSFLGTLAKYVVMAFTFLFVLNTFGIQTTSIIALVGAAGLAVGLALQGTLTNVAAGVMLIFFRPIKEGDFVEVGGQTGTVKEISINFTELAGPSNVQIIIPNSQIWGNTIVNYSVYKTRRAEWTIGVSYDASIEEAERIILETIRADERTMADPAPFAKVTKLGESSVDILAQAWVSAGDLFAYQSETNRAVKAALDAAGIGIPYPHRTLTITREDAPNETSGGNGPLAGRATG